MLPQEFIIDNQEGIREPIGMSGVRLEAKVHLITGAVSAAQNITKCIERCGLVVDGIILEQMASSYSVLEQDEKEIKIKYACALTQLAREDETIEVPSVGDRPPRQLARQTLAEVVEPRYEELLMLVQAELRRSGFEEMLAAGVVLTGGSAKMEGVIELAEEVFHLPVRLGLPTHVGGLVEVVRNPIHATGVGLLLCGNEQVSTGHSESVMSEGFKGMLARMKSWFQGNF